MACGWVFFALGGNLREDFFNRADLLGLVVDDEIALVTEFFNVLARKMRTPKRMESADRRTFGFFRVLSFGFRQTRGFGMSFLTALPPFCERLCS